MKHNLVETALGAVVIVIALTFLVFSLSASNVSSGEGYIIEADFSGIGGLSVGDEVQISGVKVGSVHDVRLNQDSFLARVFIEVNNDIQLPIDTAALISSESLLGGKYLALEPGAEEDMISPGGQIRYTQAPQNLEQLLGQFIFSMQKEDDAK